MIIYINRLILQGGRGIKSKKNPVQLADGTVQSSAGSEDAHRFLHGGSPGDPRPGRIGRLRKTIPDTPFASAAPTGASAADLSRKSGSGGSFRKKHDFFIPAFDFLSNCCTLYEESACRGAGQE